MRFSGSQFLQILRIVLGSISAVSWVRSLILPEERLFRGMSVGSFSRTATVIEPRIVLQLQKLLSQTNLLPSGKKNSTF